MSEEQPPPTPYCTICLDSKDSEEEDTNLCGAPTLTIPCNHHFGASCIQSWIEHQLRSIAESRERKATCPLCRGVITHLEDVEVGTRSALSSLIPPPPPPVREDSEALISNFQRIGIERAQRILDRELRLIDQEIERRGGEPTAADEGRREVLRALFEIRRRRILRQRA